jgi:hypothetical protein
MGTSRTRRIGRGEAELLVSGTPVAGHAELARLLRYAAAPASVAELTGHRTTVAAMVSAFRDEPEWEPRRSRLSVLSRALLVKVAAALGVLLLGGTALAAGTGNLPGRVQHGAHSVLSVIGVPVPDATASGTPEPRPSRRPTLTATTPPAHPSPGGAPSAAARGLCQAWYAQESAGRSPEPALLHQLAALAGATSRIPAYCAAVLGLPPPGRESPSLSPAAKHPTPTPHATSDKKPSPALATPDTGTSGGATFPGAPPDPHPDH